MMTSLGDDPVATTWWNTDHHDIRFYKKRKEEYKVESPRGERKGGNDDEGERVKLTALVPVAI